jgi:PAS domain-containing protein
MDNRQIITNSIISDMSEGVMAIRFDGKIELVNDAALEILARTREELEGHSFARCFFDGEDPETGGGNDAFTECVLASSTARPGGRSGTFPIVQRAGSDSSALSPPF